MSTPPAAFETSVERFGSEILDSVAAILLLVLLLK